MRFLADESCDFSVVRALRAVDHDVVAVTESNPGAEDEHVIDLAARDGRIVLTEDKDFGQLVYADKRATGGVLFIRFPAAARTGLPKAVVDFVKRRGSEILGRFVVVQPGRVRIGKPPRT
jgi:hypothetical protein